MKKTLIKQKILLRIFLSICLTAGANISYGQFSQKLLSESWSKTGGQGISHKNVTLTDASKNVYVAGATSSGVNNSDIIVQKLNRYGVLQWEKTYAGTAGMNDAASAMFIDASGNVYVTGTVVNSVGNDQDLIVLKYNSSGVLQWNYTYHGSSIYKQDAGTAITGDALGNRLYVAGTAGNDNTMFNYRTISLSPSTGSVVWSQSYDYDSLVEIPKKILYSGSYVTVVGASQESGTPFHWEMATVRYNYSTGAFVDVVRSTSSTVTGINEINDVAVDDATGSTYLIGALQNTTTGFDIAVYKLDASLNLVWQQYYDIHGLEDKGTGIEFASGNLYLTGYSTKSGFGKETLLMKINTSGTVIWQKEITGGKGLDDKGEQIILDGSNRIYVAASVNDGAGLDYKLYCYDVSGNYIAEASFNGAANLNDVPQSIEVDLDNNIIITGYEQTGSTTYVSKTVKYGLFERSYNFALDGTRPKYLEGSVLVKFKPQNMKSSAMNARKFHAGLLNEFIDSTTLVAIQAETGADWSRFKAYKVFKNMSTVDSTSITRLGNTIKAKDFWTYLAIDVPRTWEIDSLCDSLLTITNYIRGAEPNTIHQVNSTPNDLLYSSDQLGLYPNATYPGADINVAGAWGTGSVGQVGQSYVKVGVVDGPINWAHEEFNNGTQNLPGASQKIGGGFNYYSNQPIYQNDQNLLMLHGNAVAGIIGAKRNNYAPGVDAHAQGIAGIAGGDMGFGNYGAQLYSLGICYNTNFSPTEVIADALYNGFSNSPSNSKNVGCHILNASWGTDDGPYPLLKSAIEECWRNHCIFVTSRGNLVDGAPNVASWPACFDDLHVINVIASGTDGERKSELAGNGTGNWSSAYGMTTPQNCSTVDFMAPGTTELVTTTSAGSYAQFAGTSAAAPHVSGVTALMYSEHHTNNGYPNNLSTEDIENVMQKTATDKGTSNFDLESGFGLINAYEALKQVSDPYYVKHITATPTITTSNTSVTYTGYPSDPWVSATYPNSKKYVVTWDIDVTLPGGHEIIGWWELEAATVKGRKHNTGTTISLFNTEALDADMVFDPIGGNHVHRTAETAVYLLNGADANPSNDIWFPFHPNELKYYFSVHVHKSADAGIEELENSNYVLYPNPSNQQITIKSKLASEISNYEIIDAMGRVVVKDDKIKSNEFTVNVVSLTQGVYYCRIYSSNSVEVLSFIKSKE